MQKFYLSKSEEALISSSKSISNEIGFSELAKPEEAAISFSNSLSSETRSTESIKTMEVSQHSFTPISSDVVFFESMDGIEIERVVRDYEFNMPTKHFHDQYEIYYLTEGERYYFIGSQTYHIKKGSLVFINRNEIHRTGSVNSPYHDRILLLLSEEPFASFFSQFNDIDFHPFFGHSCIINIEPKEQAFVENLLLSIHQEMANKLPGYRLNVMMAVSRLLIYAIRYDATHKAIPTKSSSMAKHKKVDQVADYIISHCTDPLSLDDLSRKFYVNKCYLSRIFKEVTGFTVNEYINIHRINKAASLLTTTDDSITEIADACGYESLTYFEKVFRTYRDASPLKYRMMHKERREGSNV